MIIPPYTLLIASDDNMANTDAQDRLLNATSKDFATL